MPPILALPPACFTTLLVSAGFFAATLLVGVLVLAAARHEVKKHRKEGGICQRTK